MAAHKSRTICLVLIAVGDGGCAGVKQGVDGFEKQKSVSDFCFFFLNFTEV